MNRLKPDARARVINCLIEGCSIRSTVRMTGTAKKTVMRLLVEIGAVCEAYQDLAFRNLRARRIQVDELWGFNYCKARHVTPEIAAKHPMAGDVWLWVAVDADTKLVPSWHVGDRDLATAYDFMHDLANRLVTRVQLTSVATGPTWRPWRARSTPRSTTPCSRRSGLTQSRDTARPSAWAAGSRK